MPTALTVVAVTAACYLAVVAGMYAFQRNLLYLPDQRRPSPAARELLGMETVVLNTADGLRLSAWYREAGAEQPTIVHFHGNGGNIGSRAHRMAPYLDAGFGLLMVEYRGYGGNPGEPTEDGLYEDGRAALAFLDRRGVAAETIVLYGESLGSGVAVQLAADRGSGETDNESTDAQTSPVAAVVLEAPLSSVTDVAAHHYPYLPVRWLLKDRFESEAKIPTVAAPVLVIHGERDRVVPIRYGHTLFEAAQEPKEARWVPEAGHEDLDRYGLQATVIDFVQRHTDP